jgi:hypothetical protein
LGKPRSSRTGANCNVLRDVLVHFWRCRLLCWGGEDWTCFEDALAAADFWSPHRDDFRRRLDGACWTILGRRNGLSHVVHRWSPCGPVYNLGRRFIELAELNEIRGHFRKKFGVGAWSKSFGLPLIRGALRIASQVMR